MAKVQKGVKIKNYPTLRFFIPIGIKEKSGFQNDNPSTLMLRPSEEGLQHDTSIGQTIE